MRVFALLICLAAAPLSVAAQTAYQPPVGVPAPAFGTNNVPGPTTHFVNSSSAASTDVNNPAGTAAKPRKTIPASLAAGSVVEVRGGPYNIATVTWYANGTAAKPVFIKGIGAPVFKGIAGAGGRVIIAGQYFVIDGLSLKGVPVNMATTVHHFALRHSSVTEYWPGTPSSAIAISGQDVVLLDNEIAYNGDVNSPIQIDIAGVYVMPGAVRVWVLNNRIHHNGGDAVLVGSQNSPEPWASFVYVGGNVLHEDRENGVDIKRSRDVIVSQNVVYGYSARDSSSGESIVSHYLPERVWILNNLVALSQQGIVSTGATGYFVAGNVIAGIRHATGTPYDPLSLWGASGILTYNTTSSAHVNNTIWASDSGINIPSGGPSEVINNLITGLTEPSGTVRYGSTALRNSSTTSNNWTGSSPLFVNPAAMDFRVAAGSPVIDAGVSHWIYSAFQSYYGVPLNRDIYGETRLLGSAYDIGAAERR